MDAAQIAGLNCLRLMNETTAGTLKCGVLCARKATCYLVIQNLTCSPNSRFELESCKRKDLIVKFHRVVQDVVTVGLGERAMSHNTYCQIRAGLCYYSFELGQI